GRHLDGNSCADGYAARDRRQAVARRQRCGEVRRGAGAAQDAGHRSARRLARGVCALHRRRIEEMGRRRQRRRDQEMNGGTSMRAIKSLAIAAMIIAAGLAVARAQSDYPNKPVRLVVGFTPGSVADITARVLGNRMGQILGQQFVIENKPGAASNLAAEFVARAPKDGYTLFLAGSVNVSNAAIQSSLSFDIVKDFAPVALINEAA